jgi:hypothetical protein
MTNEMGRDLTSAERIAIATGQTTVLDILHGVALELDAEWESEVHTVMPSGTVITKGALWREMHASTTMNTAAARLMYVIGLNASSNMFA